MFTFEQTPTYQSDESIVLSVSDDKRALTLIFSDLQTAVEGSKSLAPVSTRIFSLVLPLKGEEKRVEIEFFVSGYIFVPEGATASVVFSVNGQTAVADFTGESDKEFLQELKFAAETPSECRLCVFLLLGRDSRNADVQAYLNVSAIDAEILPRSDHRSD